MGKVLTCLMAETEVNAERADAALQKLCLSEVFAARVPLLFHYADDLS